MLWARMLTRNLDAACKALVGREGCTPSGVASWSSGNLNPEAIPGLSAWAESRGVSAVIWTALPPKFSGEVGRKPTSDEAVQYLSGLQEPQYTLAKHYVQNAPQQIDTHYRRLIVQAQR